MSRIHDALRRLARERAGDASNIDPAEAQAQEPGALPEIQGGIETDVMQLSPSEEDGVAKPNGLLRQFAEQCPRTEWAPDRNRILFYGEDFPTSGSEEFRTLRSRLDLARERRLLQSLLITSPMPREGKTFVAANLAQVMVWRRERHVLLIDGDLRASSLHHSLGVPVAPGLSDYLSGAVNEFAVVRRGPLENLFFIPAGTSVPNASELIANGRFRALIKRLAVAFDWIIIDSPPVIPVADARVMAECCDGVLMVVRSGETPGELAQLAYSEFRGKSFVGVLLNGADPRSTYGYDYYSKGLPSEAGRHLTRA